MDNKRLGIFLIIAGIVLGIILLSINSLVNNSIDVACECSEMEEGGSCPHEKQTLWSVYLGLILISALLALGVYMIFFEKTQKEIVSVLENQKKIQTEEEKYELLLKGLNEDEKKVLNAVKEQDGITQETLRLRADMHKSKLSIILSGLEKKELIKKVQEGKTNKVFIKFKL
jgi:uncharacterized membrane protein